MSPCCGARSLRDLNVVLCVVLLRRSLTRQQEFGRSRRWLRYVTLGLPFLGVLLSVFVEEIIETGEFLSAYFTADDFAYGRFAMGVYAIGTFTVGVFSVEFSPPASTL